MAFPDESYGILVSWYNQTNTGWAKDDYLFEGELMLLESDKSLSDDLNIGDRVEYIIYYETQPPYKPYVAGFRKYIKWTPSILTEQELQEIQKQQKIDKIIHKFGKMVWFLYIGSIVLCTVFLLMMWLISLCL